MTPDDLDHNQPTNYEAINKEFYTLWTKSFRSVPTCRWSYR